MVIINQWKTDIVLFLWSNKGVVQNKMINVTWTQTRMPSTSYFVGTIRYLPRPHLQWQPRGNFGFGALPKYTFDRRHSVIGRPDLPIDPQIPLMESLSCVKKKKRTPYGADHIRLNHKTAWFSLVNQSLRYFFLFLLRWFQIILSDQLGFFFHSHRIPQKRSK